MKLISEDYLMHYGVKGMKWGVRHDPNPNYSDTQRQRDRDIYGRTAERRINKSMNKGSTISGARSKEATRINVARRNARVAGNVGSIVGGVGGAIGGYFGTRMAIKVLSQKNPQLREAMSDPMVNMVVSSTIASGSYKAGTILGRYGAQNASMLASGYNPKKFR